MNEMVAYRLILQRVGAVLVVVGLLDIAVMIYCVISGLSYSSSFNVFAVILGIFLYRGGIRAAKFATAAAAFFLAMGAWMLLLLVANVASGTLDLLANSWVLVLLVAILGLLYWIYRELRREPILAARRELGMTDTQPKLAFALGGLLPVFIAGVMFLMLSGDGPYRDLEVTFPAVTGADSGLVVSDRVVFASTKHRGSYNYDGVRVTLSDDFVELNPQFPLNAGLQRVQIPEAAIAGCSKTCGGWWTADLLIESTGTEISLEESQSVLDWCWNNRIPMISGADRREWLYNGASLPGRESFAAQLGSREQYDRQATLACQGY